MCSAAVERTRPTDMPAADERAGIAELTQQYRAAARAESASVTASSSGQGGT